MWRLKYLLIGMIFPALVGVGGFLVAPRMADALRDAVRDGATEAVAESFSEETPNRITAGQIRITEADLEDAIENTDRRESTWNISGLQVSIQDGVVRIVGSDSGSNRGDDVTFASAVPQIQEGRFVLTDRSGVFKIFKTAEDAIADEIEAQVAALFSRSGIVPISVTAENGRLVIVTEPVPGSEPTTTSSPEVLLTPTAKASPAGSVLDGLRPRTPTP